MTSEAVALALLAATLAFAVVPPRGLPEAVMAVPAALLVVDHAPCALLLAWPDRVPDLASIPPPPPHPPPPPPGVG